MRVLSSYIILLTITFCAVLIYRQTSKDLPFILAAITAVVCFFWGFALAPWLVQLSIVGVLMRFDKFYLPKERQLS